MVVAGIDEEYLADIVDKIVITDVARDVGLGAGSLRRLYKLASGAASYGYTAYTDVVGVN